MKDGNHTNLGEEANLFILLGSTSIFKDGSRADLHALLKKAKLDTSPSHEGTDLTYRLVHMKCLGH